MLRSIFSIIIISLCLTGLAHSANEAVIAVDSSAFEDGEEIPGQYSLSGSNISPPISWSGLPQGAKSVAVICNDPDAPKGRWAHWVIFNIPPDVSALPENLPDDGVLPRGIIQGINDFGRIGWDGPSPPKGTHRYVFEVYALDKMLDLEPGTSRSHLLRVMKGHVIGRGKLIGTYER